MGKAAISEVGAGGDTGHEGEPTTMPTHDLDDKGPRVGSGSGLNIVDHLAYTR